MQRLKDAWYKYGKPAVLFLALVMTLLLIFAPDKHLGEEEILWGSASMAIIAVFLWNRLSRKFDL